MGIGEQVGFYVGYSQKHFGSVRAADVGEQARTGYDEWAVDSKLVYWFNPDLRLTLAYQQVQQDDVWRSHRTIFGEPWEGTTIGNEQRRSLDQERQLAYLKLEADEPVSFIDAASLTLSWQRHKETRDRIRRRGDDRRDLQGFDLDALGASIQFESESPIGALTYGASFYRDDVDSFRHRFNADGSFDRSDIQGPVGDDATYDLFGVFLQDKITLGEDVDLWLGGRYTHASADADRVRDPITGGVTSVSDSWNDASFSLRGLWRPLGEESFQIFGGVSQGFRAPNLSDLSRLDSARSNEIETAALGLDPEEFVSFEIGSRINTGDFEAGLSYFYTDIEDMIVRTPTGRMIDDEIEVTKKNAGDGYIHGIEFDALWQFHPQWSLFGNFTWMDGEVDTFPTSEARKEREPISRLMPPTGLIGLRYEPNERVWLELSGQFAAKQDDLSSRDQGDTQRIPPGGTPSYALVHLRGGWQINDNLTVNVALENLTDEDYRVHGSGQNEPGFNGVVSLDARF